MKLNKLFLLLALPLAFAACEPVEPEQPGPDQPNQEQPEAQDPVLTLTSENSLQFGPEGGEGTITYTLENAVKDTELTATSTATWITDITVGETITFNVEANDTTEERNDRVLVSYGNKAFNVFIKQSGVEPVVKFEAKSLDGFYYGTEYSVNYNIMIYLSELGFNGGNLAGNGTYYVADLYMANEPVIDTEGYITIPVGTYTYDGTDSFEDMTMGYEYSFYCKANGDGTAYTEKAAYESAELVVTENSINFVAYVDGVKHVVTYNNAPKFYVGVPTDLDNVNIETPILMVEYYANMYTTAYNYNIFLFDKGTDEYGYLLPDGYAFSLDLYGLEPTPDAEGYLHIPAGTYTFDPNGAYGEWNIGRDYSYACKVNFDGTAYDWYEEFDDVVVEITENSIRMEATINDAKIIATHNGEPKFYVGMATYAATTKKSLVPAKNIGKF